MIGPILSIAAYLIGSISFGLVMASREGVDLRNIGSGNVGATNVARALGQDTGRKVMLLDMLKGFVPVALARWVFDLSWPWITAVGIAAVLGHVFPLWHGLRGGKGAATAAGVLLAALPAVGVTTLVAFVIVRKLSQRASAASLAAATIAAALTIGIDAGEWPIRLAVGLWIIVMLRHAGNVNRLLRGEEPPS